MSGQKHDQEIYKKLKDSFDNVAKKICNYETRELPVDQQERQDRINEYKEELITAYNELITYVSQVYAGVNEKSKDVLKEAVGSRKLKILRALLVLGLTTDLPEQFGAIELNNIVDKDALAGGVDNSQIFVNVSKTQAQAKDTVNADNSGDSTQTGVGSSKQNAVPTGSVDATPASSRRNSNESINSDKSQTPPTYTSNNPPDTTNQNNNNSNTVNMALPLSDILNGIPDFSGRNYDEIKQFIAKADLIHKLASTQEETVLHVIRTKLVTANKLGNISGSTWTQIKKMITEKYRVSMSFETAQERLLSIKQAPKESLDEYANRIKILLDALNSASSNSNADVQAASQEMNESLAVRKFKQNIFDEKIRIMALSTDHTSLTEAIAHATEKKEQLQSSNVSREMQKNENKNEQNGKNGNGNGGNNNNGNNKKNGWKKREQCAHCKKTNHASDRCYFRPRDESASSGKNDNKTEKFANRASSSKNMNVASADDEKVESSVNGLPLNQVSAQSQSIQMQPYRYLNC